MGHSNCSKSSVDYGISYGEGGIAVQGMTGCTGMAVAFLYGFLKLD